MTASIPCRKTCARIAGRNVGPKEKTAENARSWRFCWRVRVLRRSGLVGEDMGGNLAEVPDDAQPGHDFQRVIGDVNLPPEETLARGGHEVVMVVVPAFAEGKQGEQPVVAAGVAGLIAARTEKVRKRIDGEGVVPEEYGAQAERPDKQRPSADEPQDRT